MTAGSVIPKHREGELCLCVRVINKAVREGPIWSSPFSLQDPKAVQNNSKNAWTSGPMHCVGLGGPTPTDSKTGLP